MEYIPRHIWEKWVWYHSTLQKKSQDDFIFPKINILGEIKHWFKIILSFDYTDICQDKKSKEYHSHLNVFHFSSKWNNLDAFFFLLFTPEVVSYFSFFP